MGTEIYLRVGPVVVDSSKNNRGADHGVLFQDGDQRRIRSEEANYEYCEQHGVDTEPAERALGRSLKSTVPRLELLGFTVEGAKKEYDVRVAEWLEYQKPEQGTGDEPESGPVPSALQFQDFLAFLARHPLNTLDDTYVDDFYRAPPKRFAEDPDVHRIPSTERAEGYSDASYFGSLISVIHPYSLIRVLALIPENEEAEVTWQYGPMVFSGWAQESDFTPGARRTQTFLIATEGSSDVHILQHALHLLRPEIEDFFRFIDISERHPFSGTGSLVNFAEGLTKIDVQNQMLFLFDNDAEGWDALEKVNRLKLPSNMRAMALPDLTDFRQFAAFGPQGVTNSDINRRAAAIECYLDLRLDGRPPARVIWTNYKERQGVYQGSLEYKDTYKKKFLDQTSETIAAGAYDVTRLKLVLNRVFEECTAISVAQQDFV